MFTPEMCEFIRTHADHMNDRQIGEALGVRGESVHSWRSRNKVTKDKSTLKYRYGGVRLLTGEQHNWFLEHNASMSASELAEGLNSEFGTSFTPIQIRQYRTNHKLPGESDGRFQKGNVPFTKGKKWDEYMSAEAQKASRSTCYKAGDVPSNYQPVGTISEKDGYLWIKVTDRKDLKYPIQNWRLLHRHVWETANGPIPEGMAIVFLNGDRKDCRLENLELMTVRERGFFRQLASDDAELAALGVDIAKAKARLYEPQVETRRKKNGQEGHRDNQGQPDDGYAGP